SSKDAGEGGRAAPAKEPLAKSAGGAPKADGEGRKPAPEKTASAKAEGERGTPADEEPAAGGGATGANTAAKVPSNGGLEQHVEGAKKRTPDNAGIKDPDQEDTARFDLPQDGDQASARGQKVVDITRGARPAAPEPEAAELPPAPAAPSV